MIDFNAASDALRISGYASLFDRPDMSGDIVRKGAFSASILALKTARLPMLFGHETQNPIGVWDRIVEDKSGLFVSGLLISGAATADRTRRLVEDGAITGLSIGYRALRYTKRKAFSISERPGTVLGETQGRNLLELDLWEVSLVAFPMLRDARITQIDGQASLIFHPPHTGEQRE